METVIELEFATINEVSYNDLQSLKKFDNLTFEASSSQIQKRLTIEQYNDAVIALKKGFAVTIK